MLRFILFFLLFSVVTVSCNKNDPNAAVSYDNVWYGTSEQQRMDIYLPRDRSIEATKTFVMIHGGGWSAGDKADMQAIMDALKNRFPECAFVNINYRLAVSGSNNFFPVQENDINSAIDYYLQHATEYHVSNELILVGLSAGAHLALMKGYKHNAYGDVKAVIDGFGPTDLVAAWNLGPDFQTLLYGVTGKTCTEDSTFYANSSPVNFVNDSVPPTLILQGGADEIVPASQSYALRDKLQAAGATHQFVYYPLEGHGWVGSSLTDTYEKIEAFVREHVF